MPEAQELHVDDPATEKVPGEQVLQVIAPTGAYEPLEQHTPAPAYELEPDEHELHADIDEEPVVGL